MTQVDATEYSFRVAGLQRRRVTPKEGNRIMGDDATEARVKGKTREKIRQPKDAMAHDGELTCEYSIDPTNGVTAVRLFGDVSFVITETTQEDGTILYASGVVESLQDDLKEALQRSVRNCAVSAANAAWAIQNPRAKSGGRMTAAERDAMERAVAMATAQAEADRAAREAMEAQNAELLARLEALEAQNGPQLSVVKGGRKK